MKGQKNIMKKYITIILKNKYILLLLLGIFFFPNFNAHALSFSSTYRDMPPSSSNTQNLLSLAQNYSDFNKSKFVVFSDSVYSYYIVWSKDLKYSNSVVTGTNIKYIRYYRTDNYSDYRYLPGTDTNFSLSSSYNNTSSIPGYGFVSQSQNEFLHFFYSEKFLILICGFTFVIAITSLKRSYTI